MLFSDAFELQPTLTGQLIRLRPLNAADWDELYQCAADPLIWEQHPQKNRYEKEIFRKYFDGALTSGGALVAVDQATGGLIGSSRYYDFRPDLRQVKMGYTFLARKYWGGRFNGELKSLMLKHAFRFVDAVLFDIGAENVRSRRAMERTGGQLTDTLNVDGLAKVIYRISRESWKKAGQ